MFSAFKVQFQDLEKINYQKAWDYQQTLLKEVIDQKLINRRLDTNNSLYKVPNNFLIYSSGIFVQPSSLRKLTPLSYSPERERRFRPINFPMLDTSSVPSRVDTGNYLIILSNVSELFVKV